MGVRSTGSQHPTTTQADGHLLEYFRQNFGAGGGAAAPFPPTGLTASGGVISDYTVGSTVYRAHVFTSSGTFEVTDVGSLPTACEYLVVAGGGGGGADQAGGGGAGGLRTNLSGHPLATNNPAFPVISGVTYPVTVGGGGRGNSASNNGSDGTPSVLTHPDANVTVTALGGGGGGSWKPSGVASAGSGGSGGGAGRYNGPATGGSGSFSGSPANPQPYRQGYPGGNAVPGYSAPYSGAGGGGAGGAGSNTENDQIGTGGAGVQVLIAGPPTHTGVGATGPSSPYGQWFAGGGGGGSNVPQPSGHAGGGGAPIGFSLAGGGIGHGGSAPKTATMGMSGTGGGGGGGSYVNPPGAYPGASGGSGIVVIRYAV